MWAIRKDTLAQVLDRYTQNAKLRSILSAFWPYYGLPPSKLSGFYYAVATAAYIRFGGYYIKHRSQDLSDALVRAIDSAGGQVLLNTEAIDITLKGGDVTGVVLDNGKNLAARAIISNASVPATLDLISRGTDPEDLPRKAGQYAEKIKAYWRQKEKIVQALIKKAEKHVIPGLSSMIEVVEAATPLTNITYTRNPEGSIYGYEQAMNNAYMNRLENTTPYRGLYLASAWSNPGGGFQPCLDSGAQAFKALVKEWGVKGAFSLRVRLIIMLETYNFMGVPL